LLEAQHAEAALRESEELLARELSATQQLQSVSALLIEGGSPGAIYERILVAGVAIMDSDMASMQALDEDQDALRMLAWKGFDPAFGQIFQLNRADTETSCSAARRTGHRVVVPDVENCDLIVSAAALEDHRKMGIRAVQSTPLFSRDGRLLGILSTHWRAPHMPTFWVCFWGAVRPPSFYRSGAHLGARSSTVLKKCRGRERKLKRLSGLNRIVRFRVPRLEFQ
jgi:GAF domain-containing protein